MVVVMVVGVVGVGFGEGSRALVGGDGVQRGLRTV
jgi:hypothetical protein